MTEWNGTQDDGSDHLGNGSAMSVDGRSTPLHAEKPL